jgi:hypothetical protein
MLASILAAITAACNAYSESIRWTRETYIDRIEDEIDNLASVANTASTKLRIKRLLLRKRRIAEQFGIVRSSTDSSD